MEQSEITIRELRSGRFVACLPGSERIGPTVDSRVEAEVLIEAYHTGPALLEAVATPPQGDAGGNEEVGELAPDSSPGGLPDGYTVEKKRGWFVLIGPNGKKVGKSKRSPEEAAAQAPAE